MKLNPYEVRLFLKGQLQYATVVYERDAYFAGKAGALMLLGAGPIWIDVAGMKENPDKTNCKFKIKLFNSATPPCPPKTGWRVDARLSRLAQHLTD